jgi:hypothetical protein
LDNWAGQGGSIKLVPLAHSEAYINDCVFINSKTSFNISSSSEGGGIYLDLENSQESNLIIKNITVLNSVSKTKGGFLLVKVGSNGNIIFNILITDSYFNDLVSTYGGFIYAILNKDSHSSINLD